MVNDEGVEKKDEKSDEGEAITGGNYRRW